MNIQSLKPLEIKFWNDYIAGISNHKQFENILLESAYAGTEETTDGLLKLYLMGRKTAGSSLKENFIFENDPIPKLGNHWIVLNSHNEPECVLKTIKIIETKFKNITEEVAIAEGEGDLSLKYWKSTHESFYAPFLETWGIVDINETIVITEFFDLIYPLT